MEVLALERVEDLFVEVAADSLAHRVRQDVDAGLDGRRIAGAALELAAARKPHDALVLDGDENTMRSVRGVVREPLLARLERDRLEVERDVRLAHVVVVDVVDDREVVRRGGPYVDAGVDHGAQVYFGQLAAYGPDRAAGHVVPGPPRRP